VGAEAVSSDLSPSAFLRLVGHPLRWQLLSELGRSDREVRELMGLLGQPQSLVSYHLGRLRAQRLVSMRRSSADGRDAYYTIDLERCGELLAATGGALHPALRVQQSAGSGVTVAPSRVLFLCTGNSSRSQIAEALLRARSGGIVEAYSAGSHPRTLHPDAVRVMGEYRIDISKHRTTHIDEYLAERFDWVISLCDRVREICPEFPGHPQTIHWSIADPAAESGSDDETYPAFQRTAAELDIRIRFFLPRLQKGQRASRAGASAAAPRKAGKR
jgi:protein-tyrosine-phosphatase/DNA-binding transcriptional ArsR family regulator